jgi:DNA topoisomerase-1
MARSLVIVESPAKAKTINKFLGKGFVVKASMGHVRDLPKKTLGVDEKSFKPTYTALPEKKKTLAELRKAAKDADSVYLAADPDREGEAICWHLKEELSRDSDADFRRVLFNEITKNAIVSAFEHPRDIDAHKVDAQQARRILDRFVGYKISPLLWDKVRRGLSAGRVQSVALRIIVEREREIKAFVPKEYWSLAAQLWGGEAPPFTAKLFAKGGKKIEIVSREEMTRALAELGWEVVASRPAGPDTTHLVLDVKAARADAVPFKVTKLQSQEKRKSPAPPFITSKLQQDAARQLGFPVAKTMRLAQGLYEGREIGDAGTVGLITYMRTDSTRTSEEALEAVRAHISATYGVSSLPKEARRFKSGKSAQEAHEAIRPTLLDLPPDRVRDVLGRDEFRLYQLIWNRFVASQMEPAVFDTMRADLDAGSYTFRATGSVLKFAGWLAVYHEGKDEDALTEDARPPEVEAEDDEERRLPRLAEGQTVELKSLLPRQHFTSPPPRFSEATLVKELEENGIGRPSTYAAIIATIMDRSYAEKDKGRFFPTELGQLVNDLIVASFGDIVDVGYTARMEEELDEIEEGRLHWVDALREFQKKFEVDLARAKTEMRDVKREAIPTDQVCEKCGKPMVLKWGRFGQFLACSGYPDCKTTREIGTVSSPEPVAEAGSTLLAAAKAAKVKTAAPDPIETEAEPCQKCGRPMVLKRGRFGAFLACSGYPECKTTRKIVVGKEGKAEAKPEVLLDEPCPKCGSKLAVKQGRFGEFTACSNYPKCRYIKMKETGVPCPECGKGKIVERKSKRGKLFYGCDRYPDCGFVLWNKPVPKACPRCKSPYLVEKTTKKDGRRLLCEQDSCGYVEQVVEEAGATA